jgi:glycosyltransferase involved in cell wall biosynthesis
MGGIEKNLVLLTEEFVSRNHCVLVGARTGVVVPFLENKGAKHFNFYFSSANIFKLISDIKKLYLLLKNERPDIIHIFSAVPGLVAKITSIFDTLLFWLKKDKFPTIVSSIMGLQETPREPFFITHLRNFITVLGSRQIFIISPQIEKYMKRLPISRKRFRKLKVVGIKPVSKDIPFNRDRERHRYNISTDKVVVTIGHLGPRKSHELFIKAASEVLTKFKEVTFLIAGEGPDRDKLQNLIDSSKISKNVKLIGLCRDIYPLLSISDICVKPGILEGFIGITVMEAQSMSIPVIAFDTIDVRLAITDGETGFIVEKGNVKDLADKILLLLKDNYLANKIGTSGDKFARSNWTIDFISRGLLSAYGDVLNN